MMLLLRGLSPFVFRIRFQENVCKRLTLNSYREMWKMGFSWFRWMRSVLRCKGNGRAIPKPSPSTVTIVLCTSTSLTRKLFWFGIEGSTVPTNQGAGYGSPTNGTKVISRWGILHGIITETKTQRSEQVGEYDAWKEAFVGTLLSHTGMWMCALVNSASEGS